MSLEIKKERKNAEQAVRIIQQATFYIEKWKKGERINLNWIS